MAQLPSESQFGDYGDWPGRDVLDSGGERLGGVREIYLDRETGHPEWVLVDVDGGEARFVPLADATVESSAIRVAHSAERIREAPGIGTEPRIDQSEERRLYEHYGIGYSTEESASGLPAQETSSSWSDAAPTPEAPSPQELDEAETGEPPAASEPEDAPEEPAPVLSPSAAGPSAEPDRQESPSVVEDGPEEIAPAADVFTPPEPPPAAPPPPEPEPERSGPIEVAKSPKAGVIAGLTLAAILFFIVRRLR